MADLAPRRTGYRLRIPTRRLLVAVAVAALLLAWIVVAVASPGYPSAAVRLSTGQVWLASSHVGQIALVDGTTGEVVDRITVAPADHPLTVAQPDGDAVVADATTGDVSRFDTATLQPQPKGRRPLTGAGTQVFDGPRTVQAVSTSGQYVSLDATTLAPRGAVAALGSRLDPATTVVDGAGRLWALDVSGSLIGATHTPATVRTLAATPAVSRLAVVGASIAVVDPVQHRVTEVKADGVTGGSACLPAAVSGTVAAGVSSDRQHTLVAADATGSLVVVNLASGSCSRNIALGPAGTAFGTPVTSGGRAFVPDLGTGKVYVVDLATGRVLASPTIIAGGSATIALLSRDGAVFYNDTQSDKAGVIRLDGSFTPIQKYVPASPTTTPSVRPKPTVTSATPTPTPTSPATGTRTATASETLTLSVSPNPAVAGQPAHLQLSTGSGTALQSATWSFGDGSAQGSGVALTHTWASAGTYQLFVRAVAPVGALSGTFTLHVVSLATVPPTTRPPTTSPTPVRTTHPVTSSPHTPIRTTQPTQAPTTSVSVSPTPSPTPSSTPSPPPPTSAGIGTPDAPVVMTVSATAPDQTLRVTFTLDGVLHGTTFESIQYKLSDGTTGTWTAGAGGGAAGTYTLTTSGGLSTAAALTVTLKLCTTVDGGSGPCSAASNSDKGDQPYGLPNQWPNATCSDHLGTGAPAPIIFRWSAPQPNGRPIDHYTYQIDGGPSQTTTATSVTLPWAADASSHGIAVKAVDDKGDQSAGSSLTCDAQWPDPIATGTAGPVVSCPGLPAVDRCEYLIVHLQWLAPGSYYDIDFAHYSSWEYHTTIYVGTTDYSNATLYWHTDGYAEGTCASPCTETVQFRVHDVRGATYLNSNAVDWAH